MVRNKVPFSTTRARQFLHVLQFREVLFGNVVYQLIVVIEATAN